MEVSVRELKSRLSEYLRRVAEGEELIVTSHGREVARIVSPRPRRRSATQEREELIARFRNLPFVRAGLDRRPPLSKPLLRIGEGEKSLAEIVNEDRG